VPTADVCSQIFCHARTEGNCIPYYEGSKYGHRDKKGKAIPCNLVHANSRNEVALKALGIPTKPTAEFNAALGNTQKKAQDAYDQKRKEFNANALSAVSNLATVQAELDAAQADLQATQGALHATQAELEDCIQALDMSEEITNQLTVLQAIYVPDRCEYCDMAGGVPNYNGTGLVAKGCLGFNGVPGYQCKNIVRVARFVQPGMYQPPFFP
jgi:hypothetical protein